MRKSLGLLTLLASAGLGAYVWQESDGDRVATERLAAMVRIVTEGSRAQRPLDEATPMPALGSNGPARVQKVTEGAAPSTTDRALTGGRPTLPPRADFGGGAAASQTVAQSSAPAIVEQPAPVRRFTSVKPGDEGTKRELTKSIQAELRRVGCFDGEIDGSWSSSSRQAMKRFTDRVNATLPIDQPDYILLTLLQGHEDRACGKACPSGQVAATEGRCQPRAVVAQEERKQARQSVRASSAVERNGETSGEELRQAATAKAALSDAQIIRDRSIAAAREKEQRALEERQARLDAEKLVRQRTADEQRQKAEQAAEEARRKQVAALEQRKAQELARLETERQAKARASEERREKAELAAAEARRKQELADVERRQQAEARLEAERKVADAEARRRTQLAEAEQARRLAAQAAQAAAIVTSAVPTGGAASESSEQAAKAAGEPAARTQSAPGDGTVLARDAVSSATPGAALAPAKIAPPKKQRAAVRAPEPREEVREVPRAAPRTQPRFVQRFYPPPYYVGRVSVVSPPVYAPQPVVVQRRIAPSLNSRIFHDLGRNSP